MMRKLAIIFILLIVFLFTFDSCVQFRKSKSEIDTYLKERNTVGFQTTYPMGRREIHYVKTGREDAPLVLFVHGSPGSLNDYLDFLTDTLLQKKALLISVDRPGFGQSNFGLGEPSLGVQSALIRPLVEQHKKGRPVILVGHSLGGPVIARMAMDYPELIDGLIFVAASVDPELEPARWWRAPLVTSYFRWMIPRSIRASNDEIYALRPELEEMLPMWENIHAKTIVIHGTKDSLVPFGNSEFLKNKLSGINPIMITEEGMNHFVPWSHPHLIHKAISDMIEKLE